MPARNDIDIAIADIVGEYAALKKAAKNSSNPPLGMENTDLKTAAKRFEGMNTAERKRTQERIGPKETMRIVRQLRGNNGKS